MNSFKVNTAYPYDDSFPAPLRDIPYSPKKLFWIGANPSEWADQPKVAIVGSRKVTSYGQLVTDKLAGELAACGVAIVSGLALGIDSIAHRAVLRVGGLAIVILPSPVQRIYPASHRGLAEQIVNSGGTIMSEYPDGSDFRITTYIERNRLVSGLADILLITEAAAGSGTMHTARFALEQGKTVMCVPGNITSPNSEGTNNLIKSGAVPVTDVNDILFELNIKPAKEVHRTFRGSPEEKAVLKLITEGISSMEDLAAAAGMDGAKLAGTLTSLEINGHIRPAGGGSWTLA